VAVARLARESTEPGSVVIGMIHSGSLRYYGSRMTLRYDILDPEWLDRGIEWMTAHGVRVYAVVEDWELERVKERFASQRTIERFARPSLVYKGPAIAYLYDLSRPPPALGTERVVVETFADRLRAVPPAPPPTVTFSR
jgi:hypothetical protein